MPYKFFINVVDFHLKAKKNPVREIVECTLPSDSSQIASSSSQMASTTKHYLLYQQI
jgi:hypothetical protein